MTQEEGFQGVTVADLEDELGTYRATIFKIVRRLGIEPYKRRDEIREWLASLDADEVTANIEDANRLPEWIWEKDGWRVRFGAMPTICVIRRR